MRWEIQKNSEGGKSPGDQQGSAAHRERNWAQSQEWWGLSCLLSALQTSLLDPLFLLIESDSGSRLWHVYKCLYFPLSYKWFLARQRLLSSKYFSCRTSKGSFYGPWAFSGADSISDPIKTCFFIGNSLFLFKNIFRISDTPLCSENTM